MALKWDRKKDGSHTCALGLCYYAERADDNSWLASCVINNNYTWTDGHYATRYKAERAMESHFNDQLNNFI